jgi:hypothetical protein
MFVTEGVAVFEAALVGVQVSVIVGVLVGVRVDPVGVGVNVSVLVGVGVLLGPEGMGVLVAQGVPPEKKVTTKGLRVGLNAITLLERYSIFPALEVTVDISGEFAGIQFR